MLIKLQYFWTIWISHFFLTIIDFLKNWSSCAKSHLNESGFKIIALPNTFYKVIGSHRAIFFSSWRGDTTRLCMQSAQNLQLNVINLLVYLFFIFLKEETKDRNLK